MRRRTVIWTLALAVIFGFGWYKSYENQADRKRRAAWDERMQRLQAESNKEVKRIGLWLNQLHSQPGARENAKARLQEWKPLVLEKDGEKEVAAWTHPEYGIRVEMDFWGEKVVAHGLSGGTAHVLAIHPQPERFAASSPAEHVREVIVRWGLWVWLACLMIAMALPSRYGLIAAEATLAAALVCGVAWTVAPNYSITVRGILSNDRLFFAAIMVPMSLALLAMRVAPFAARSERNWPPRYGMRTLLTAMGIVAVLLAMGPLGYFTMCVAVVGGFLFFILLQRSVDIRRRTLRA